MTRIGLIGAGSISRIHAEALATLHGPRVSAIVDPDLGAAERLARTIGVRHVASIEAALAADLFDRAHVLVPPDLHGAVGELLLRAGKPVLLEKPLAASIEDCERLLDAANDTPLGVNQNYVHHPAFAKLRACLATGALGPPSAIICAYNLPLPQLAARRYSHWLFRRPGNMLLEHAVHPLSQIATLAGPVRAMQIQRGPATEIAPGLPFVADFTALLDCPVPAQLRFAVGQSFPHWQITAIASDGVAIADMVNNRFFTQTRTRRVEPIDLALSGIATGTRIAWSSAANLAAHAASTLRLRGRSDAFFRSMRASIGAFHTALDAGNPPELDGMFGASLVELCERIAAEAMPEPTPRPPPRPAAAPAPAEIAVLGGTGFIGTHLVRHLVAAGRRAVVMSRNPRNLPAIFDDPLLRIERGDITDGAAVAAAIAGCRVVVNLAHSGDGAGFEMMRHVVVGGAETVARACRDSLARRLIHVGSIAALYLGPQRAPITGRTPPDPREAERSGYARAKALADRLLLDLHHREGLPVVILRPGLVVGAGSSPFHPGIGRYFNEQHCIGWNKGRNPLPFVLAEDVAEAILRACDADGIEGQCYNLIGGVRPSARDYTAMLAAEFNRPLRFHPRSAIASWLAETAAWAAFHAAGNARPFPSWREILSRGLRARFDCTDARHDLSWSPNADAEHFRSQAVLVHLPPAQDDA